MPCLSVTRSGNSSRFIPTALIAPDIPLGTPFVLRDGCDPDIARTGIERSRGKAIRCRFDFAENEYVLTGAVSWMRRMLEVPFWTAAPRGRDLPVVRGRARLYRLDARDPSAIRVRGGALAILAERGARIEHDPHGPIPPDFRDGMPEEVKSKAPRFGSRDGFRRLVNWIIGIRRGTIIHDGDDDFIFRFVTSWADLKALFIARDQREAIQTRKRLIALGPIRGLGAFCRAQVVGLEGEIDDRLCRMLAPDLAIFLDRDLAIPQFQPDPPRRALAERLYQHLSGARIIGLCRGGRGQENPFDDALRRATYGLDQFAMEAATEQAEHARRATRLGPYGPCSTPDHPVVKPGATFDTIVSHPALFEALRNTRDRKGTSAGPDGLRPGRIGIAEAIGLCDVLLERLKRSRWRPGPSREVAIPKADGGTRTIRVANVPERVVSSCLADGLRELADGKQPGCSHGWRPGRSHMDLLRTLADDYRARGGGLFVIDDVRKCFDRVAEHSVQEAARHLVPGDRKLRKLLVSCTRGIRRAGEAGIDQGSALSPLVMNLILSECLDEVSDPQHPAPRHLRFDDDESAPPHERFADNLVAIADDREEAERIRGGWARSLARGKMELKGGRGLGIFDPSVEDVELLGFRIRAEGGMLHFGPSDRALRNLRGHIEGVPKGDSAASQIASIVGGWLAAYAPLISPGRDRAEARERTIEVLQTTAMEQPTFARCVELVLNKFQDGDEEAEAAAVGMPERPGADRPPARPRSDAAAGGNGAGENSSEDFARRSVGIPGPAVTRGWIDLGTAVYAAPAHATGIPRQFELAIGAGAAAVVSVSPRGIAAPDGDRMRPDPPSPRCRPASEDPRWTSTCNQDLASPRPPETANPGIDRPIPDRDGDGMADRGLQASSTR